MKVRTFSSVVSIATSAEDLWELTIDVAKLPAVSERFKRVELVSDALLEVGSRVRLWQPQAPRQVWTVETLAEPTVFSWSTKTGTVKMLAVHEVVPTGENECELHLRVELTGFGASVLAKLLGSRIQESIRPRSSRFRLVHI